jgi:hypothetical protein
MTLLPNPWTRVNDRFVYTDQVNAAPVQQAISHIVIPPYRADQPDVYGMQIYQQVALDVVTETVYHYPYPYFSEKTYRPMINRRMFIVLAPPGVLAQLHRLGFETWGDLIDQSYDQISDPEQRLLAVVAAVENFCALPLSEIQQYMKQNQQKFDRNYDLVRRLEANTLASVGRQLDSYLPPQSATL